METFFEMLMHRAERLIGRTAGPLNFRLAIMPLVVAFFAVRAGIRDARKGDPPFFRTFIAQPGERGRLLRSALKDVGKIFLVAVALDTTYQLLVLKEFFPGEVLVVAVACAVLPYLVLRSIVSILMRRIYRRQSQPADQKKTNE